jgi:glycine/D-amino acid oxidase-like deaminating enzyme
MRCVVVGAGAWGLPAAAELARRGHRVTLVDRYGPANLLSSSPGPTRLWRLTHPDGVRIRLALRSLEAMERLSSLVGEEVFLRRGLLWRDDASGVGDVVDALAGESVRFEVVDPTDVGRYLPGLRPDRRPAVWTAEGGPVLAAVSMQAQQRLLASAGGELVVGRQVEEVTAGPFGVRVRLDDGAALEADTAVLAPGPGAVRLLDALGVRLALRPRLEQVVHLGSPEDPAAMDGLACLVDRPHIGDDGDELPNLYAMPTPGRGYKVGIDRAVRDLVEGDLDRTPSAVATRQITERVRLDITGVPAVPLDAQVHSWTGSPDGRFVLDVLPGGVVVACGDSGEGFKFSALMGHLLADLAEGRTPDPDVASFGLARFATV